MDEELTSAEAAKYLGIRPTTLACWRSQGKGPAYTKLGRIVYKKSDLDSYKAARRVEEGR